MQTTFINASNTAAGGTNIGPNNFEIEILKIIIGKPVSSGNIAVYSTQAPGTAITATNAQVLLTLGSAIPTSQVPVVIDFTDTHGSGMLINSGNVMIDQTMQVTVLWDIAGAPSGHE